MNKTLCFLMLLFIFSSSCKKNMTNINCIMLSKNSDWSKIDFKADYTIQFPSNYHGGGMEGFEGNTFSKIRDDKSAHFTYIYSNSLFSADFGDTLAGHFPNSIDVKAYNKIITLNQNTTFCDDSSQLAIVYYNDNGNNSYARLYWKDNGIYKQALEVFYNYSRIQEIFDIIKTIKKK